MKDLHIIWELVYGIHEIGRLKNPRAYDSFRQKLDKIYKKYNTLIYWNAQYMTANTSFHCIVANDESVANHSNIWSVTMTYLADQIVLCSANKRDFVKITR